MVTNAGQLGTRQCQYVVMVRLVTFGNNEYGIPFGGALVVVRACVAVSQQRKYLYRSQTGTGHSGRECVPSTGDLVLVGKDQPSIWLQHARYLGKAFS